MNTGRDYGFRFPAAALFAITVALAPSVLAAAPLAGMANRGIEDERTVRVQSRQDNSNQIQVLARELARLKQDLKSRAAPIASGGGTLAADTEVRMAALETELRRLTGEGERLDFRLNEITERLDKLMGDMEYRLSALEGGAPRTARPATGNGTAMPPANAAPVGGGDIQVGVADNSAPGILGTISARDLDAVRPTETPPPVGAPAAVAALVEATGSPQEQYEAAFGLLRQGEYIRAEQALGAFVERHASDSLAGNAQYWLGETYYVRRDFEKAAMAFLAVMRKYPGSPKNPDSMLKLGMSLIALGDKAEGCATLSELLTKFPKASPTTLKRATRERGRATCG